MYKTKMYKLLGGINWCLCRVIAEYEGKIWIHNLNTGSMPIVRESQVQFKDASDYINELKENNK